MSPLTTLKKSLKQKSVLIPAAVLLVSALVFGIWFLARNTASAQLARKVEQAPQIKSTYKLDKVSLILPAKDENSMEIKLGEPDAKEFVPNLELTKWDGEVSMKIKPTFSSSPQMRGGQGGVLNKEIIPSEISPSSEGERNTEGNLTFSGNKINYQTPKEDYRFYDIPPNEEHKEGAYEFEVILKEKPQSNVVSLDIETEKLDFYYQGELTKKDIERGASRPENIIGSYAAYHRTKKDHIIGQKNYATGKAFHIYRPKIIDAKGNWVWGEFNKDLQTTKKLAIAVPQNFLDTAAYPIIVDPTFGYTNVGASNYASNSSYNSICNVRSSSLYTASSGDTITQFSFYTGGGSSPLAMAAYSISGGLPDARLAAEVTINTGDTPQWYNSSVISQAMTGGTTYCTAFRHPAVTNLVYYDDLGGNEASDNSNNTLPTTWSHSGYEGTVIISMYATYTAGASCGDGTCNGSETHTSCPADCRATIINKPQTNFMKDSSLVGYWSFDGSDMNWASTTAEALDRSGNSNNGNATNMSSKTAVADGKVGQALSFDGVNDSVNAGNDSSLNLTSSMTLSAWIYPIETMTSYQRFIDKSYTTSYSFSSGGGTNDIQFWLNNNQVIDTANNTLILNTWQHLAVTFDDSSNNVFLYINGSVASSSSYTGSITGSANDTTIGSGGGRWTEAMFDEVRIYNRALSASEIQDLYRVGAAKMQVSSPITNSLTSGLVGNWTFNGQDMNWASTTAEALDRSGNNNNGNATNMSSKTAVADGKVGQALNFDGVDDYVNVANNASLSALSAASWSWWYRNSAYDPSREEILGKGNASDNSDGYFFFTCGGATNDCASGGAGTGNGRIRLTLRNNNSDGNWNSPVDYFDNDNQWHYVAVTWNGAASGGVKFYKDGLEVSGTEVNTGTLGAPNDGILSIGEGPLASDYISGLIDEVRVYNRALGASEIQALYQQGSKKAQFKKN